MAVYAQTDCCQLIMQPKKQKYDLLLLTARTRQIQSVFKIPFANETNLYSGFHLLP